MEANKDSSVRVLNVLVVDDHRMLRDGLRAMLLSFRKAYHMNISEAGNAEKGLQLSSSIQFDLAIVDYRLGGVQGDEMVRRLLRYQPQVKVLALSNYADYKIIELMIDAGAMGFVLKTILPEQLLLAIETVLQGTHYYCNEVALVLLTAAQESEGAKKLAAYQVSARELEVLLMIADGMNNESISRKLFLAKRTVDTHRQNLLKKLKVKNTAGLVRIAVELKMLK